MSSLARKKVSKKKILENEHDDQAIALKEESEKPNIESVDFLEFYGDIERHLDDLKDAIKNTKNTKELAISLKKKGFWTTLSGSFSGRNTKELAKMVEDLGASMETTQIILQLVMKVQNTKNKFLRQFHDSLTRKISLLEMDSTTLDANQRAAAVAIVTELKDQLENQLEQREMVDRHQKKLQVLDGFVESKHSLDNKQNEKLVELESRAMDIIRTDEEQQRLIEELKRGHASKDKLDSIQTQRIDSLMMATTELELYAQTNRRTIEAMTVQQKILIEQLKSVKQSLGNHESLKSRVVRQIIPTIAIFLAIISLSYSFF